MAISEFDRSAGNLPSRIRLRQSAINFLRGAMEAGVLVMICLSPWAFGSVGAEFEAVLYAGIALLLIFWAVRMLLEGELSWTKCPLALVLAALVLYGAWQLTPLPGHVLGQLSPATARMYQHLLPAQAEVLPFHETRASPILPAGSTISFYPGRTWQEVMRLLAVFLLFALVRNNIASAASLRRLAIVALLNGVLLALFAILQFFTSPADRLYWTWPSPGTVFGPFVCRNHFAFYLNMCLGLGIGLLSSRYVVSARADGGRSTSPADSIDESATRLSLLHDPLSLWISAGLALMISSVVICASRGGIVAFLSGWLLWLALTLFQSVRFRRLGTLLLTVSMALALVLWFGLDRVEARFANLWDKEVLKEGRLHLWLRLLPSVKDFPVWGTGYGTLQYLEPLYRTDPANDGIVTNAENDYLEALLEGGVVRLALSLLAIGLVFGLGYRAIRRHDTERSALAAGALCGFAALVVQSFVDFGLHIPAIALLATVLCAQVCALGGTQTETVPHGAEEAEGRRHEHAERLFSPANSVLRLRLWGLVPLAGATLAVLLGLLLASEGARAYRVQEFRSAAGRVSHPPGTAQQMAYLSEAARLAFAYASPHVELALIYYDSYRGEIQKLRRTGRLIDAAQAVLDVASNRSPVSAVHPALSTAAERVLISEARKDLRKQDEKSLVRDHLVPALRCFLQARDLCPLLPEPQRFLADAGDKMQRADPRIAYLERAVRLVPYDPALWYMCGDEVLDEQPEQAWKYWRRSLELSDCYLSLILTQSGARLTPHALCTELLPHDPKLLLRVASEFYGQTPAEGQVFLDQALDLVQKQSGPLGAEDLHVKALILCAVGLKEAALAVYQAALAQEPQQVDWRLEFARLLYQQKRLRESRRELFIVLAQKPDQADARALLTALERQIAESM